MPARFCTPTSGRTRTALLTTTLLMSGLLFSGQALAQTTMPSGGQVVAGAATIGGSGSQTVISQSSDKAIINWTDFSIGKGGEVTFNNGDGATLNRVTGGNLSTIDGLLKATGSVYLINPNGVIIGKTGVVNVGGGFIASALDISNTNFLGGGDQTFSGPSLASVVNLGKIGALGGDVALMAVNVQNSGTVEAANGTAGLVAGHKIILRDSSVDDGKFLIVTGGSDTAVSNDGAIAAASAELRAEGGNIYALAGNTSGVIRATGVAEKDGKVWLTAGAGGSVNVSGSTITAGAANGDGGEITVTGGQVKVAAGATLDASATAVNGNGGTILAIADMTAGKLTFAGTALAEGGSTGGNGGFVETSGHAVDFAGARINTFSLNRSGRWLIDPENLVIDASNYSAIESQANNGTIILSTGMSGANDDLGGTGTGNSAEPGDIIINHDLTITNGAIVFDSYHSVQFNANLTANAGSSVYIFTNDDGNYTGTGGGTGGDYYFAQGKNLTFTDISQGQLYINDIITPYTLVNSLSGLQAINNTNGHYALVSDLSPGALASSHVITYLTQNSILTGLGHAIDGLTLTKTYDQAVDYYAGLVGENHGTIRDLGMTNFAMTITYNDYGHGVEGGGTIAGDNETTGVIKNVWVTGAAGGIVGGEEGGLVGYNYGLISNSYATIDVSSWGASGGLVAYNYGTIENTYATGNVISDTLVAGGLVGQNADDGAGVPANRYGLGGGISDSYSTGTVSGVTTGGLVGLNYDPYITGSTGTVTDSYWNKTTSGLASSAAGAALTTTQLQDGTLPSGFSSAWTASNGANPSLTTFGAPVATYQLVNGLVYTGSGALASGATVTLYSGGSLIGTSSGSGSDGAYSIQLADGTITSSTAIGGLLTLNGSSTVSGLVYTNAPTLSGGDVTGFDIHSGLIDLTTGASGYIALQNLLNTTFGTTNLSSALAAITNPDYKITTSGAFTLDSDLTGGGAVAIKTGGDLTIDKAITVNGSKALTLDSHDNLYVNANLTASGGNAVTLKTTNGGSGDYYFALGDSLSFTGSGGSLDINGNAYTLLYSLSDFSSMESSTGKFALAKSLDATASSYTASVVANFGTSSNHTGIFTGLGNTISNLNINTASGAYTGLFGYNFGTIRDIGLIGGLVHGQYVGALAGYNYSGTIKNAFSSTTVTGSGSGSVGGLAATNSGSISNSFATGAVIGGATAGGLVASNYSGTITNSYASGPVYATAQSGGLAGINNGGTITTSFATGAVSGAGAKGGLSGNASGGTITNSYYDSGTTGAVNGLGTALTTAQLQGALPSGFSSSTWATGTGLYPYLKTFYPGGLQAITGTAAAAAQVALYTGGTQLGSAFGGANGYYYFVTSPGTVTASTELGGTLTLNGASAVSGLSYTNAPTLSGGNVTGFNLQSGLIDLTTDAISYSGLQTPLSATFGSSTLSSALSTITNPDYKITTSGAFTLDSDLTGGGAVAIKTGGDLTIDNPITVSGSKALTLDAHDTLYINANLTASGSNAVTITTANGGSGDYDFASGHSLSFTGSGGSLTINGDAYTLLRSMSEIAAINNVNGKYALADSLDASGTSYTSAVVGNLTTGSAFAGLGHTISGLTISGADVGLFRENNGLIRDLGLAGGSVSSTTLGGGLVSTNNGDLKNVYNTGTVSGAYVVGGLAGANYGTITNAYATGAVSGVISGSDQIGGLVGSNSGTISNAYATGAVSGDYNLGGLVGANHGTLLNVYAMGSVTGDRFVGGLVGQSYGNYDPDTPTDAPIINAYATGAVSGTYLVDGLVGNNQATLTNGYYNSDTAGVTGTSGATPLTTAQIQSGTLPSGFDTSVWGTAAGLYPYLKSFGPVTPDQKISGYAYNADGSAANAATVGIWSGGASLGVSASTGANGYYYILVTPGTATSSTELGGTLTLSGASSVSGLSYTNAPTLTGGDVTGFNIQSNLIDLTTGATSYSNLQSLLTTTFGSSALSSALTGITSPNYKITASGAFNFDQALTTSGSLALTAAGGITLSADLTTGGNTTFNDAVTLATDTTLTSGGALTFASTINGAHNLTLTGASLDFDGAVGGTTALTSLTGTATAGNISVGGQITTTGAILLAANGSFSNTAGASALNAGGDFTVYTQNASDPTGTMPVNSFGGLTATNYYNDAYNFTTGAFASAVPTGDHFVYAYAASLTPTLSGTATKTYDAALTADTTGLSVGGTLLSADDSVTFTIGSASYDTKNAGTGKTVTANVSLSSNPNNYTLSSSTASAAIGTINKAALTLAAATGTKTYDATTTSSGTVSISGLQGSDTVTGLSQSYDSKNAGSRTLSVNGGYTINDGNSGGNYTITTQTAAGTISKAALTLAAVTGTKTYDATTTSAGTVSVSGLQGSDTVTGLSQSYDSQNAGSRTLGVNGGYTVNDGNSGGNYTVTTQTASGTINKAALTLAAVTGTKTYDATTTSGGTVTVSGLQGSDTIGGLTQSYDSQNAGSRTLAVNGGYTVNDGNSGGNYTVTTQTASGTINKATLTLAAVGDAKTYDATTTSGGTVTVSGLQGSDTVGSLTQSYDSQNAGSRTLSINGGYVVNDGNGGGNYTVTTQTASGTINKAALTLAAVTGTKTYDATTTSDGTVSISGLQGSDTVGGLSQSYDSKNAGSRTLAINAGYVVNDGNGGGNYTVTTQTAAGMINKATLVAGLTGIVGKTYDATTDADLTSANYSLSGVFGSDDVTLNDPASGSYADKNAGTGKTVSVSGLALSGGDAGNYTVNSSASGNVGTINKAALTLAAVTGVKTYDATTTSLGTVSVSGLQGSDTVTGLSQSYNSQNAGSRTLGVNGGYVISDGNGGGNYTITTQTASGTINKAALTLAAVTGTKTYDATTTSGGTVTVSGLQGSDTVGSLTQSYDSKNAGSRTLGVNSGYIVNDGNGGSNYTVTTQTASGTIDKATLVAGLTGTVGKTYDATTDADLTSANYSLTGVLGSDDVALNDPSAGSYANQNAGTGKTVSVSGLTLSGGDAGNYTVNSSAAGAIGAIDRRAIAIAADDAGKITGAGDPLLTWQMTLGSLAGNDTLTGGLVRASGENPGDYAITKGSLAASDNYAVTFTGAKFTIAAAGMQNQPAVNPVQSSLAPPPPTPTASFPDNNGSDGGASASGNGSSNSGGSDSSTADNGASGGNAGAGDPDATGPDTNGNNASSTTCIDGGACANQPYPGNQTFSSYVSFLSQ